MRYALHAAAVRFLRCRSSVRTSRHRCIVACPVGTTKLYGRITCKAGEGSVIKNSLPALSVRRGDALINREETRRVVFPLDARQSLALYRKGRPPPSVKNDNKGSVARRQDLRSPKSYCSAPLSVWPPPHFGASAYRRRIISNGRWHPFRCVRQTYVEFEMIDVTHARLLIIIVCNRRIFATTQKLTTTTYLDPVLERAVEVLTRPRTCLRHHTTKRMPSPLTERDLVICSVAAL